MLNDKGFDLWANGYDKSVELSEEANEYPFAGYKRVLGIIYSTIRKGKGQNILDIGFGTGMLTKKLYDDGCSVYGIDFSEKMIEIAKTKMPDAILIKHDFSEALPASMQDKNFDFIVCTYAIHHLDDPQKIAFIRELTNRLSPQGMVLIGDVAFETVDEMERCRSEAKDGWDADEIYPIVENLRRAFPSMRFEKISFCAGVFTFVK